MLRAGRGTIITVQLDQLWLGSCQRNTSGRTEPCTATSYISDRPSIVCGNGAMAGAQKLRDSGGTGRAVGRLL